MKNFDPIIKLKLSIQRALLGEITENLFAVTASIDGNLIKIVFYFRGEISEDNIERSACVSAEVMGDFPEDYDLDESWLSLAQNKLQVLDFWAFRRAN